MFKNIPTQTIAAGSASTPNKPGDERLNNEVNYEESAEPVTTKTVHTLQDEDTPEAVMQLDSVLDPLGFANKSFQMTEMLERNQIMTTSPINWSSHHDIGTRLHTVSLPRDLTSATFFKNKMENFFAIHADMEITCKVNPTPFDQGALLLVLHPQGKSPERIQAYSFYPHELINLPMVNHAALRVPFLTENEAYSKSETVWEVSVYVVARLKTATLPKTLEVNLFGRFVNPELMIPIAQSANSEVADQKKDGLVTKITGTVADVLETSGTALRSIPVVGEFIPPITWAARCANKIASYFGWSKPPNMENAGLMIPIPGPRMCHGEGIDNGIPLSLSPDNTCNTVTNSTDIDEMDFAYLFERKFVNEVLNLQSGNNLLYLDLNTAAQNTSTNFLTMFAHRRWMRNFEFHMVKTKFHTGRLLIQYDYNNSITSSADTRVAMSTVYSKIVDISVQDSFIFTIPWMDISPFDERSLGRIVISTFNDIVAAETVSQDFDIIVYHSYRDVQVGLPRSIKPFAQGDCCGNAAPIPTDDLIPYTPKSMVEYTMGESVSSLRLLSKRFTRVRKATFSSGTYTLPRDLGSSLFGVINSAYLARAGSVRYKIVIPRTSTVTVDLYNPATTSAQNYACHATQVFNGGMNNVIEFTIPFYYPKRRAFVEYPWPDVVLTIEDDPGTPTASGELTIYAAAGDDYNAMFPLGLDTLELSHLLYSGLSDDGDRPWVFTGILARHDVKSSEFTVNTVTEKHGSLNCHIGDGSFFEVPQEGKGASYRGGLYGVPPYENVATTASVSLPALTFSVSNVNGNSQVVEKFVLNCDINSDTHGNFKFLSNIGETGVYGRCVITGTFSDAGVFTPGNYNIYFKNKSATEKYIIYFSEDSGGWVNAKLKLQESHPDYFTTGRNYGFTNHVSYLAGSHQLTDMTQEPQGSELVPYSSFVATFVGHVEGGFTIGGNDIVLANSQPGAGDWIYAKSAADDHWYQYSVKPGYKRQLFMGDITVEGISFPDTAKNITRVV